MRLNLCTPRLKRNQSSLKTRNDLMKLSYDELKQAIKDFPEVLGSGCDLRKFSYDELKQAAKDFSEVLGSGCDLRKFSYDELKQATKDFSEVLGSGCFGSVYRGMLPDSTLVAVKKLVSGQPPANMIEALRRRETLRAIESVQHINVLPVIGICDEGRNRILLYKYMPRKSLDLHLFHQPNEEYFQVLDWNRRYQIALGAARGLDFCSTHGNIKPENIILDSDFCPKLADHYRWCFWNSDEHHSILTTSPRTKTSYSAPEVLNGYSINRISDVYSYGMILFEMISGIRNSENGETPKSFPTRIASVIREGGDDILSVLDGRLGSNADEEEVLRVCKVACRCIHDDPQHRPSMKQVIDFLEGVIDDGIMNLPSTNQLIS